MRGKIASLCIAFATITVSIWTAPSANARLVPAELPKVVYGDTTMRDRDISYETTLYCLALAVYFEGGSTEESEEGQRHIAQVVVQRARANRKVWGGSNICDVVFYQRNKVCQFSFACLPLAQRTVRGGALWRYSKQIARDELEGRSGLEDRLLRYYMNASLTPAKNACRFRKEFVPVAQVGRHEFFREATRAERRELEKGDHAECKKHEASLKRKKAKKDKGAKSAKVAKAKDGKVATAGKTGGKIAAAKPAGKPAVGKAAASKPAMALASAGKAAPAKPAAAKPVVKKLTPKR